MSDIPPIIIPNALPGESYLPDYPVAGVGVVSHNESPVNITNANYLRVNSFSAAILPNNTAVIAVASQDTDLLSQPPIKPDDRYAEIELSRREAARVYISGAASDETGYHPTTVRNATVDASDPIAERVTVVIDGIVHADRTYQVLWVIDGEYAGTKLQVEQRLPGNLVGCKFSNADYSDIPAGTHFNYVSYASPAPTALAPAFEPLPFIEYNGFAIPAVNPQVATNASIFPAPASAYAYVVCQAPVNGTYQLFFYGLELGTDKVFMWTQLTFNGENKNPRIKVDTLGNLHIVWESSRCGTKNGFGVYYGVLGTSSRGLVNEAFISALDKQAQVLSSPAVPLFSDPLLTFATPVALDLRSEDEYGTHYGPFWNAYTAGSGSATVADSGTITLSGNPSTDEFNAFGRLSQDQDDAVFDGKFSQLSYQVSFKLNLSTGDSALTEDTILQNYVTFKSQFTPVRTTSTGINVYAKSGKQYTIGNYTKFDGGMIPLAGSYELGGLSPTAGAQLKHFMIAAVPEKVAFEATNITDPTDTVAQTSYTGKYKLSLVFSTAANLSDPSNEMQSHHAVRDFGSLSVGTQYDFKIAVHYAHLHSEQVAERAADFTVAGAKQSVRFTGNLIVAVNNKVLCAENFVPAFGDDFFGFDIGLGVLPGKQYAINASLPYNQSVFENQSVTLLYSSIAVGPHTILADPFLTHMAQFDRNCTRMVIKNTIGEGDSRTAFDEAFLSEDDYGLSLGLYRKKITLSQVPLTFEGRNTIPALDVDGCGRAHVAYQSNRDGNWQIYYTGTPDIGTPFRFDTRITTTASAAMNPTIAVDQMGRRFVAWQDDRNGNFQIYGARSNRVIACRYGSDAIDDTLALATGRENDEYDPYDPYGSDICGILFSYTNETQSAQYFNFSLRFYTDREMASLKTVISSQSDKTNWLVNGDPMPPLGIHLQPGDTTDVAYYPRKSDNVSGDLYYVHISGITPTGSAAWPYVYAYYCPVEQTAKCTVPCSYTNSGAAETAHFRVSFYEDQSKSRLVLSADSSANGVQWTAGPGVFPTAGITVPSGGTCSVVYVPNVLPAELYYQQDQSPADSLLCGATYYVSVEKKVSGVYTNVDDFIFECPCSWVDPQTWRSDRDSGSWVCSGQGAEDVRVTATATDALFPSAAAAQDGTVYISWEGYQRDPAHDVSPAIFFAVWDANRDRVFSSAQGSYDQRVTPYSATSATRYWKPLSLVGHFQNPTFFFSTRNDVFRSNCSIYRATPRNSPDENEPVGGGVFTDTFDALVNLDDAASCLDIKLVKDDVADLFHANSDTPIPLVKHCLVRLDIKGPTGTYAVRLRNENESQWSDWLSILPELPDYPARNKYALRGDGTMRDTFEAFFISGDRFIVPWVLSAGSGSKTIYAQILTYMGRTPQFSLDAIARYDELRYKVEFFTTDDFSVPVPTFNGVPVVSTEMLATASGEDNQSTQQTSQYITANDVSSITRGLQTVADIKIKVTFFDHKALKKVLDLTAVQKFSKLFAPWASPNLSFNVLQQGVNAQYGLPLVPVSEGVYTGSFSVTKSDGVYNRDGEAAVVVNVPDPATKLFTPEFANNGYEQLDTYNVNLSDGIGDFGGQYTVVPQYLPQDFKARQRAEIAARVITSERFRYKYDRTLACTFTSAACVSVADNTDVTADEASALSRYTGPLTCSSFDWTAYEAKEPFYYKDDSNVSKFTDAPIWVRYSPPVYIDMGDQRVLEMAFLGDNQSTGILFIIKPTETIVVTGGARSGDPVTFTVPANSIVISNTGGFLCGDATALRNASAAKTFNMGSATATVPGGSPSNDGTVGVSDVFGAGWYVRAFSQGVPKITLRNMGFLTSQGILAAKFAFVASGVGHCYVRDCTCDANCN